MALNFGEEEPQLGHKSENDLGMSQRPVRCDLADRAFGRRSVALKSSRLGQVSACDSNIYMSGRAKRGRLGPAWSCSTREGCPPHPHKPLDLMYRNFNFDNLKVSRKAWRFSVFFVIYIIEMSWIVSSFVMPKSHESSYKKSRIVIFSLGTAL